MIVALARKTLLHEWRRFLPAVVAVAFSGLLLLVQAALVLGIFGSAAVYIEASKGDLWIGYPGTRTIELGRLLPSDTEIWVRLDEAVDRVEPYRWIYGDWRVRDDLGAFSMYVSGIDTSADGLVFAHVLPTELRLRLEQPDSVIVDITELDKLGVAVGDRPRINGHVVEVVGTASGLRTLGGVNILASLETAGHLQSGGRLMTGWRITWSGCGTPRSCRRRTSGSTSKAASMASRSGRAMSFPRSSPITGCSRPEPAWACCSSRWWSVWSAP